MKKKQFLWLMIAIGMLSAGSGCDSVRPVSTTQEIPTAEETNLVTTAPVSEGEQPAETTTVPQIADVLTTAATTPTTTGEEYEDTSLVELLMERMTLEQKVCQMFIVTPESLTGYNGAVTEAGALSKESFTAYPVGGLIYFSDNLEDAPQTVSCLWMKRAEQLPEWRTISAQPSCMIWNIMVNGTTPKRRMPSEIPLALI